jgi:hypothetical protein
MRKTNQSFHLRSMFYVCCAAYMMLPNICLSPVIGKLIFVLFDILCGFLIYKIIR